MGLLSSIWVLTIIGILQEATKKQTLDVSAL
jgi:hypothetical protein